MASASHPRAHSRACWIAAAVALVASSWSALAAPACAGAIGQWSWFIGGQVTLSQDNTVRFGGNGSIPPATGTWSCDPSDGKYVVTWQNGFVDTLSLSPDGTRLSGVSSTGVAVSGGRVRPASGTVPPTGATSVSSATTSMPSSTASKPGSSSGAPDHNPSVREILEGRPKPDPSGWKQDRSGGPQKGPKPFEGWE